MRLLPLLTTFWSRVRRCVPWISMLLLLPGAVAQGQMQPGPESQGQTPTVVLPTLSPPGITEPLRQRFFPPIGLSGSQRFTLTPFLSVGERYDDNIFLTPSPKESDFIPLPAAGIRLRYLPSRETSGSFDYRVGGEIFARHSDQNAVSHEGALGFASQLNPYLSLNVRDAFISTTEPLQKFVGINEATGLRDISQQNRTRTTSNIATGTIEVRPAERAIVDLLFEHFLQRVGISQELNETRYSIGTEVGYLTDIARRSKAYISYLASFYTFDENGTTPLGRNTNFRVHTVMAGWRHTFSPTLSGDAALGYAFTQSSDPAEDNLGSIVAKLNVTKELRNGQVSFGYNRALTSGGGVGGVVREDALIATFFWKATPKVTTIFASKFALYDFLGEPVVGNTQARSFLSLRPGLAYQILPLVNLALYYTYESTDFKSPNPRVDDQKLTLISQLALRERLFLSLMYDYSVRHSKGPTFTTLSLQDFSRNQVLLMLTYAPTFRF
jgi:hypothetical protein